jgi:DNA-binding CsgD family transcriptional regulator
MFSSCTYARPVASTWAHSRAHARIVDVARQPLESVVLRGKLLDVIADVVAFDAYVWLLTDPVTTVGAAPLAHVPGLALPELPALIRAKYATRLNRWTALTQTASPVGLLSEAVGDDPGDGRVWRETLSRHGIGDVASTVFTDQFGCWGFVDLWREEGRGPFEGPDVEFLARVAPTVTTALRECQARTFVQAATPHRDDVGPVVLTLDDGLRITSQTAASQNWLDVLLPPGPGSHAVPASVYNVAAQLLAIEDGIDDHPASTRIHLSDGFWLTLRAARLASLDRLGVAPDRPGAGIVVTIEETSPVERLELFARAVALTPREYELVRLLAAGGHTRTMSRQMALSEHTVQDHLKSIFSKTGARDRVTVLARGLGTGGTPEE